MFPRAFHPTVALRLTAALLMFVWTSAQALCIQHCQGHGPAAASVVGAVHGHGCCSAKAADSSGSPKSAPAAEGCAMRAVVQDSGLSEGVPVAWIPSGLPSDAWLSVTVTPAKPAGWNSPNLLPRLDAVFVPEVSLGAAARAHAPPFRA